MLMWHQGSSWPFPLTLKNCRFSPLNVFVNFKLQFRRSPIIPLISVVHNKHWFLAQVTYKHLYFCSPAAVPGLAWPFLMLSMNSRIQAVEAVSVREFVVFFKVGTLLKTCVETRCKSRLLTFHYTKQQCQAHACTPPTRRSLSSLCLTEKGAKKLASIIRSTWLQAEREIKAFWPEQLEKELLFTEKEKIGGMNWKIYQKNRQ